MSRIQARISDHSRSQYDRENGRDGRPTIVRTTFQPQVAIHFVGAAKQTADSLESPKAGTVSSERSVDLRRSQPTAGELVLRPNELLQCEYHLMDFDGYEIQPTPNRTTLISTLRRKRRGAVIGNSKAVAKRRSSPFVRQRSNVSPTGLEKPTIDAIENSVVWQTSGKGDTDFGVHFFERREAKKHQPLELYRPYVFRTVCPNSPLTYYGKLLSITWMVRVRVFLSSGDGLTFERKFSLQPV